MRTRLILPLLFALLSAFAHAEELYVVFTDPGGDSTGPVDVVGMLLSFDNSTGVYSLILLSDSSQSFQGDFRVNVNLYNPDTGTTDCNPALFQDTLNDYIAFPSDTILFLFGISGHLVAWEEGDRVATNSTPFGNPDCSSLFRSSAQDLQDGFQRDLIADGDTFATIWTPGIFLDGFESGDTSAWFVPLPCPGCPIADFDAFVVGFTVMFENTSTGTPPLTCIWEFGDNTTSDLCNPAVHTYASVGDWTVRLTVSNSLGVDSISKTVTTLPP